MKTLRLAARPAICIAIALILTFSLTLLAGAVPPLPGAAHAAAPERTIVLASTTSTQQSGLFGHILPAFQNETGIEVRVVALGTGQALDMARRGDADVVLVHDMEEEMRFVKEGFGVRRHEVMYNDFVLLGPKSDPAKVAGRGNLAGSMRKIAASRAPFVSRGDRSGTHLAELRLWKEAGVDIGKAKGPWYREAGSGMGPSLNIAAALDAYILSDRATWLTFKNRQNLNIAVENVPLLRNQYSVILVSEARHPHVKSASGQTFIRWLLSPVGQARIAAYQINHTPLFFPNAKND